MNNTMLTMIAKKYSYEELEEIMDKDFSSVKEVEIANRAKDLKADFDYEVSARNEIDLD